MEGEITCGEDSSMKGKTRQWRGTGPWRGILIYRGGLSKEWDSNTEREALDGKPRPRQEGIIYGGGDSSTEEKTLLRRRTHLKRGRLIYGGGDPFD